ncbi:hypothetical protein BDV12DRAFT_201511 [Aspergillus spectabilis]
MNVKAIVAREPTTTPTWGFEDVAVSPPGDDEVFVKITATGICHTDILLSFIPAGSPIGVAYPKILGHEGAGVIQAIGKNVTTVTTGDKVLLSYYSCSSCAQCQSSRPMYCTQFNVENYLGRKGSTITCIDSKEETWSRFFGQSSFAEYTIAAEASVVKTGMGAVANVANAGPDDVVMVLGMGAVGMAALMTAKIRSCKTIIAVDRFTTRLGIAESVGATHTINTAIPEFNFQQALREISPTGASVVVDTTGVGWLIEEGIESLAPLGKMIHLASPPPDYRLSLDITGLFSAGKTITGCIEGNCIPREAVPQMIKWYREGRFPIDKLITFFPALEFGSALEQLHSGGVLKPVLTWS